MSQRVTEVPPYDLPMYEDMGMLTRWKGYWVALDLVVNGTQAEATAITGASPIVVQNTMSCDQLYFVSGGTGVTIEYSRDGATYFPTGVTAGQVTLFPGDFIRITYTTLPATTVVNK